MTQPIDTSWPTGYGQDILTVQQLADRYGIPVQTVYVWRMKHKGPRSMKLGSRAFYRLADILAWEESNMDPRVA